MTPEGVIRINQIMVARTGEPHQLISPDLLAGACARPQNHWSYDGVEDVAALGGVLLLGIARNHPFIQGNKRSAFTAMIGFLGANGYELEIADDFTNADAIIAAIEGHISDEEFIAGLRSRVWPRR